MLRQLVRPGGVFVRPYQPYLCQCFQVTFHGRLCGANLIGYRCRVRPSIRKNSQYLQPSLIREGAQEPGQIRLLPRISAGIRLPEFKRGYGAPLIGFHQLCVSVRQRPTQISTPPI
jgi:hypothetical protein